MNAPRPIAAAPVAKLIRPENCRSCKFSDRDGQNLHCHRNPPSAQVLILNGRPQPVSTWPVVLPDQWCGQFTLRITVQ